MKKLIKSLLISVIIVLCLAVPISALEISSPYAITIDAKDGGPLYEKNADVLRPCASTTKVMSLLLFFEDIDSGRISMDTPVTISQAMHDASVNSNWSNVPLRTGQAYTVRQLIETVCVSSACGSTMALAEYLEGSEANFAARMNKRAAELKLTAQFADSTGLSSNCKTTARSMAKLTDYLIDNHPSILGFTALTSTTIDGRTYAATNELLPGKNYSYIGADGFKTGSTTPAGKCLVGTASRNNNRIITVALGASTTKSRYVDTIQMLDFGFVNAPLYPLIFKDVSVNDWYYSAVEKSYQKNLINGIGTYTFAPNDSVTRAMFVTVLGRTWEKTNGAISGETASAFPDVENGSWYQRYVDWANKNNIVIGFEDKTFRPEQKISREEMMKILYQYNVLINGNTTIDYTVLQPFTDNSTISSWAKEGAAWCVSNQIINGIDATHIAPTATADRAQMATVFVKYVK